MAQFEIVDDSLRTSPTPSDGRRGLAPDSFAGQLRAGKTVRIESVESFGGVRSHLKRQGYVVHQRHTSAGWIVWAEKIEAES